MHISATESPTFDIKRPLRLKLGIVAALLSAVPLAVLGVVLLSLSRDVFLDAQKRVHLSVATELYRGLEAELRSTQDVVDATGRALTDAALDKDARLSVARAQIAGAEAVSQMSIYAPSGELIDTIKEREAERVAMPSALPKALMARAEQSGVAIGPPRLWGTATAVLLVVPFRAAGVLTGYGASKVDLGALQQHLDELSGRVFGDDRYALFVVDGEGRFVLHTDIEKRGARATGDLFRGIGEGRLSNRTETMERFTEGDARFYGTLLTRPERQIAAGVIVAEDVVTAPIDRMLEAVIAFVIGAILIGVLLAFIMARALTHPLARLAEFAKRLAARRFDERIEIDSSDEVGLVGDALNRAAEQLQESEQRIKEEAAIRADLGRYLPAEVVDKVIRREQDMKLGGRRHEVTVLFADVVAFTPLTERLPPETVVAILNELFTILTEIVFRHGGMVDKFIGDSLMAVFGVEGTEATPSDAAADQATRALMAAEDMVRWLEVGNAKWREAHDVTLELAIGVNSGDAIVGNIGSQSRMEFTVIGEAVNRAARLESVARPQQILVGDRTRELAESGQGSFPFRSIGEHRLPGLTKKVTLYELE